MPDIREILAALDIDDRALWSEQRTVMRRSYLNAHNETVGVALWTHEDDAFMDLIDIRLALLFDRAGRLNATHDIVGNGDKIAEDIKASEDKMKNKTDPAKTANFKNTDTIDEKAVSAGSRMLQGWGEPVSSESNMIANKEWSVK